MKEQIFIPKKEKKVNLDLLKETIIPVDNAIEMFNEFHYNRIELLEKTLKKVYRDPKFEDTKFIWMPFDKLKAYVKYIEAIQKANPEHEVSGVRLYYAAYPNKRRLNGRKIKYPGQQTAFMVPTVRSNNKKEKEELMNHLPFAIKPESNNNPIKGRFVIIEKLMLSYHNVKERVNAFYKNSKQEKNLKSLSFASVASVSALNADDGLTSTISNEFQQAPPPKKGGNN